MSHEQSHDVPEITPPFPSDHWRDSEIEHQLTLLRRIVARRRIIAYTTLATWAALWIAVGFVSLFPGSANWNAVLLVMLFAVYPLGIVLLLPTRGQKQVTRNIERIDDVAALGALLEAWSLSAGRTTLCEVRAAMTRLLLRVRASDRHVLSDRHYRQLRQTVPERLGFVSERLYPGQTEFTLAVLKAVEQIGDSTFIHRVERLARDVAKSSSQRRVKAAAEECLVNLRARLDDTGAVLLRVPERHESDETLLRPVQAAATHDSASLLRPPGDQVH